jgi:hypothetical protein
MVSAIALALCCAIAHPAAARRVGAWDVTSRVEPGKPAGCSMSASYQRGDTLTLMLIDGVGWGIAIKNPRWSLRKNARVDVVASVDDQVIARVEAVALEDNLLFVPFSGAPAFEALQAGDALLVRGRYVNEKYALTGTRAAMDAVLECFTQAKKQKEYARNDDRPAPRQSPPSGAGRAAGPQAVTGLDAYHLLSNLLSGSGVTGYRIDKPTDQGVIGFAYASGVRGVFLAFTNAFGDPDAIVTSVIAEHAGKCDGKFGSQKGSTPTENGTIVRQVLLLCATGRGAEEVQYSIVQRPNGALLLIGHIRTNEQIGGGRAPDVQAAERRLLDFALGAR